MEAAFNCGAHSQWCFDWLHCVTWHNLKVFNDLLLAADSGDSAILILVDLKAACNTVDHRILISRLEQRVGIKGTALEHFRSDLSDRSFSVNFGDCVSSTAPLLSSPSGVYSLTHYVCPLPSPPGVHLQKIWHLVSLLCRWRSNIPAFESEGCKLFQVIVWLSYRHQSLGGLRLSTL